MVLAPFYSAVLAMLLEIFGGLNMIDLYDENVYCMNFTNKEIEEYLVSSLRKDCDIIIKSIAGNKKTFYTGNDKIKCIFFDGDKELFFISFFDHQTSICISDGNYYPERKFSFNEEFMFIDDKAKVNIVSSDTYGNIVYEGPLRNKTHKEMLELFYEFITLLIGVKKISFEETVVSQEGIQYPKCQYIVKVTNDSGIKNNIRFENIVFSINE